MHQYNTARFSPRFPLDDLAVYIVDILGFYFYIYGSRVEPHRIDSFDWLQLVEMVSNRASKQAPLR